jgi:hypothetical protein
MSRGNSIERARMMQALGAEVLLEMTYYIIRDHQALSKFSLGRSRGSGTRVCTGPGIGTFQIKADDLGILQVTGADIARVEKAAQKIVCVF